MNWRLVFYMDATGTEPVKDFILKQPDGAIAEILHVFKLLREFNIRLGMPYVKKIDKSGLRELRIKHGSSLYRIFFFAAANDTFILLHAIMKKGGKIPVNDIVLAENRIKEFLSGN